MAATEDPIVIVIQRESVRAVRQASAVGAGLGAITATLAVAVFSSANLLSLAVANFVSRWAIAIGVLAAGLVALYLGVRS